MDELDGARIVGVYTTQQARDLSYRSGFSVALEALKGALDDAGMTIDEIDGFGGYVTGGGPPAGPGGRRPSAHPGYGALEEGAGPHPPPRMEVAAARGGGAREPLR